MSQVLPSGRPPFFPSEDVSGVDGVRQQPSWSPEAEPPPPGANSQRPWPLHPLRRPAGGPLRRSSKASASCGPRDRPRRSRRASSSLAWSRSSQAVPSGPVVGNHFFTRKKNPQNFKFFLSLGIKIHKTVVYGTPAPACKGIPDPRTRRTANRNPMPPLSPMRCTPWDSFPLTPQRSAPPPCHPAEAAPWISR